MEKREFEILRIFLERIIKVELMNHNYISREQLLHDLNIQIQEAVLWSDDMWEISGLVQNLYHYSGFSKKEIQEFTNVFLSSTS